MSLRHLRQRLRESGRRLRAGGLRTPGVLLERRRSAGRGGSGEAVVRKLVNQEIAVGASLEAILSQLPREMDVALRRALHGILV